MEWSGVQQLLILCKSVAIGCIIGVLFDICGGLGRGKTQRIQFAMDVVLCVIAALITFFGALVVADGQLHPTLFVGVFGGCLAEHYTMGRVLVRVVCWLRKIARKSTSFGVRCLRGAVLLAKNAMKRRRNALNNLKKSWFFQKNS